MNTEKKALERVYAAQDPREMAEAYAHWASDYDRDTIAMGYSLPFMITSWVARYVPREAGPLMDAGCGTGLSGPFLRALGYDAVEGLDISDDMLELAGNRAAYRKLQQAELGAQLPWPSDHFAGVLAAGVFTTGHAPASSFDELARITMKGGHVIATVRDVILEDKGFRDTFLRLEHDGKWRPVEESTPYRAFVLAEPDVLVQTFVFEKL